jgi:hypothetical protein
MLSDSLFAQFFPAAGMLDWLKQAEQNWGDGGEVA